MNDIPLHTQSIALFTECTSPIINGVVASVDGLHAGLHACGVDATIVAPYFPNASHERSDILRVPSLPLPTSTGYRLCVPYLPVTLRARLAAATCVHVHSPFVTGWLGANFARRRGIPLVFTYHTRIDAYAHYAPFERRIAQRALVALTRAFANRTDTVIAPTLAMHDRLREIGVRVPIAIVPSSIDVTQFASGTRSAAMRALLGVRDDTPLVLAVARIAREKQLERAIDALAHAPHLHLAIVGDGPQRAALETHATRAGVRERVTFTGVFSVTQLADAYASSDALAFTSETETQGLVLAEALAAGLPIVAVETPVNREMLAGAGRLVAPDPGLMAAALAAAVVTPRDPTSAATAARRFSRTATIAAMLAVYNSISVCRTFGTPVGDHAPG